MADIVYTHGVFEGVMGNDPGIVKNVSFGQRWKIKKTDISDWMFIRDGLMHGNYTMPPLLKALPDEEAVYYRSILANP